ncbi:MAG: hypothetical protein LBP56_07145 [Odoribacteraceae bacterium]|jgi:hypothetical protein|nr:hypothetical protein [Odoribacteraceae bacterium]
MKKKLTDEQKRLIYKSVILAVIVTVLLRPLIVGKDRFSPPEEVFIMIGIGTLIGYFFLLVMKVVQEPEKKEDTTPKEKESVD